MNLIVLATLCFLACEFYIYVLIHWIRETGRKTSTRSSVEDHSDDFEHSAPRRPVTISAGRSTRRQGRFAGRLAPRAGVAGRSSSGSVGCAECERQAYEAIAKSWSLGRKI